MNCVEFQHEAMATTFAITIADQSADYARQAATAAWHELDRLENELSRYVESSDISRANRLRRDESIVIGEDTLACILLAAEIAVHTAHVFDISYASERSSDDRKNHPPFTLDPESHRLTSHVSRLHLDLGAIGKGYALDRMAALLAEWEISAACLQSGGSTALVLEPAAGHIGWAIGIGEGPTHQSLTLSNTALSGSGIAVKGEHLVDPRTGAPAHRSDRAWALAPSAAVSDALSTAFFVWSDQDVADFCEAHPEIGGAVATQDGRLQFYGALRPT
jgi:FAD:protein FMN transferase